MLDAKANMTNLDGLTSNSQTAIFRLWISIVAIAHYVLEAFFDDHLVAVTTALETQKVHSPIWYRNRSLYFQYDANTPQNLVVGQDYIPKYLLEDQNKRVITRCAVLESNRRIILKVNKGVVPNLLPLSSAELASFTAYANLMKDAGSELRVVSLPAEKLKVGLEIDYSPLSGVLNVGEIEDAIDDFLARLPYDGVLDVQAFEDCVRANARVRKIKLLRLWATKQDGTVLRKFFELSAGINEKDYATVSGHIVLDRANSAISIVAI